MILGTVLHQNSLQNNCPEPVIQGECWRRQALSLARMLKPASKMKQWRMPVLSAEAITSHS